MSHKTIPLFMMVFLSLVLLFGCGGTFAPLDAKMEITVSEPSEMKPGAEFILALSLYTEETEQIGAEQKSVNKPLDGVQVQVFWDSTVYDRGVEGKCISRSETHPQGSVEIYYLTYEEIKTYEKPVRKGPIDRQVLLPTGYGGRIDLAIVVPDGHFDGLTFRLFASSGNANGSYNYEYWACGEKAEEE